MNESVELEGVDAAGVVPDETLANVFQQISQPGLVVGHNQRLICAASRLFTRLSDQPSPYTYLAPTRICPPAAVVVSFTARRHGVGERAQRRDPISNPNRNLRRSISEL